MQGSGHGEWALSAAWRQKHRAAHAGRARTVATGSPRAWLLHGGSESRTGRGASHNASASIAPAGSKVGVTWRAYRYRRSSLPSAAWAALAALREDRQALWADTLARDPDELREGEEPATADVEGLRRFLEGKVLPWFENRQKELANRPLIREQAFGEALDPDKLERLGRYEVHLDRKLERMLTMLLRLKDSTLPSRADPFGKAELLGRVLPGQNRRRGGSPAKFALTSCIRFHN